MSTTQLQSMAPYASFLTPSERPKPYKAQPVEAEELFHRKTRSILKADPEFAENIRKSPVLYTGMITVMTSTVLLGPAMLLQEGIQKFFPSLAKGASYLLQSSRLMVSLAVGISFLQSAWQLKEPTQKSFSKKILGRPILTA